MTPLEWGLVVTGVVALAELLLWLLSRRRKAARALLGQSSGGGGAGRQPTEAELREAAAREASALEERAQKVQEVLEGDKDVARHMRQRAGNPTHGDLQDVSDSREAALAIARKLSREEVETFWLAAKQTDIELNLARTSRREKADYPSGDIEPETMTDFGQIAAITPEQLVMPDEQFYPAFAEQRLSVMQSYERRDDRKRLYILLDVSGSMSDAMGNGLPRHVWARGVTVNLLLKAVRGQAEYLLRTFDGSTHDLREVKNPPEAEALITHILNRGFSGQGTDITRAFKRAIADIRKREAGVQTSEILLITDGDDNGPEKIFGDANKVKKLMGGDIRLHVVVIGKECEALKRVATTYRTLQ